jgi:hypothetical protein
MPSPPASQTGFAAPVQTLTTGGGQLGMSCALLTSGAVQCWGKAETYLGDGPAGVAQGIGEYSARPVNVFSAGSGVVEIRSGDFHTCALLASGSVSCWGISPVPRMVIGF